MARFDDARVGDKVWDDRFGWGVVHIKEGMLIVGFPGFGIHTFSIEGTPLSDEEGFEYAALPTLHWDRPDYEEPLPPKRKKKVTLERRFVVFNCNTSVDGFYVASCAQFSEEKMANEVHRWHQTIEFEVEE